MTDPRKEEREEVDRTDYADVELTPEGGPNAFPGEDVLYLDRRSRAPESG